MKKRKEFHQEARLISAQGDEKYKIGGKNEK